MAQSQRVSGVATRVVPLREGCGVMYHQTMVAQRLGDVVVLNSGGWCTATTKLRMNQFAHEYCGSRFKVYQNKGEWWVQNDVQHWTRPFEDGMQFSIAEVA